VHDNFDCEPKAIELMERGVIGLAALGLWTLCGAWCRRKPSPGIVPRSVAVRYASGAARPQDVHRTSTDDLGRGRTPPDASEIIDELLVSELWLEIAGGYQFKDWDHIYTKDCKDAVRKAKDAERKRAERAAQRAEKRRGKGINAVHRTSDGRTSDAGYGRGEALSHDEVVVTTCVRETPAETSARAARNLRALDGSPDELEREAIRLEASGAMPTLAARRGRQ
jgi:hypothetical protein